MFYPGGRFGVVGAIGSLRMKAFRDGQQGVEKLNLIAAKTDTTRTELKAAVDSYMSLKSELKILYAEDAGTMIFPDAIPDKLEELRKIIGYNLHLLNSWGQAAFNQGNKGAQDTKHASMHR